VTDTQPIIQPFTLGVNYWPRRKAMYWWSQFDAGEVRDEFALIHELGLDLVRIFLLWDDFQPEAGAVSPQALEHLTTVCDLAEAAGLKLDVTFFTGHMSGPNWAPNWLLDGRPGWMARQVISGGRVVPRAYRNPFTDEQARQAERLLLRTVVGALHTHPAIGMWNLGNEPDIFARPPTAAIGRAWVREMTQTIHEIDSQHPVTCGLHAGSLLEDNGLRVTDVFAETDMAVMHAYPMYGWVARSPLDPDFVPFTCALTLALSGKPVLMEEFGGCTAPPGRGSYMWRWLAPDRTLRMQFMAGEQALADYLQAVLPRLVAVGAIGAVLWCFADYAADLWNKPPCDLARHERFFGLVRPDGSLKPHAQVIKDFAALRPKVQPASRRVTLPFKPADYYSALGPGFNAFRLYRGYAR
jgi:endo-1,4-beta-mannosidase